MSEKTQRRNGERFAILERLAEIHRKIKSGCYPNARQLAYSLEVSVPTINRDVEFLKDRFYAPIEYDAKNRGYYYSAERIFALNRIKNLVVTKDTFELPKDFDFALRCGGGKFGVFMTGDVEEFVIDFYDESRNVAKDCIWANDQKITDYDEECRTQISFTSTQSLKIMEWFLSQGKNACPVSP